MRIDATSSLALALGRASLARGPAPSSPSSSQSIPGQAATRASRPASQRASGQAATHASRPGVSSRAPWPQSRRLASPPLNQFALQRTYWEARWRPALGSLRGTLGASPALDRALARLGQAVGDACEHGRAPSLEARRELERAHSATREALARSGAPKSALAALEAHEKTFVSWWRESGRTACALAVMRLGQLSSSTDTGFGKVLSGFELTNVRQAPWYPELAATPGVPERPKLYKDRSVTYDLRYDPMRLRLAAATMLAKIGSGQMVHVQVLTGYLHAFAGDGRPPGSTHSLAITGYQIEKTVGGQPVRVAFDFLDPDGGGKGILVLDIERRSFQHVPANPGWVDTGCGWDYDSAAPPHRYQVMTLR